MTLEKFTKLINDLKALQDKMTELYKVGVDISDILLDPYWGVINDLLRELYGEQGFGWIEWFCSENDFSRKGMQAWDENKNPICFDIPSLYEYLRGLKNENI